MMNLNLDRVFKFPYSSWYMKFNYHAGLIDDVNLQIIDILSKDSSTPFVEIAKKIGIWELKVDERIILKFK